MPMWERVAFDTRVPSSELLSEIPFTQPAVQFKLFFHMFFSFMQLLEKNKINEVDLFSQD